MMKEHDKERFESLVNEKEFSALADLCQKTMLRAEKLEKENAELRSGKKKRIDRAIERFFHNGETSFGYTALLLIFLACLIGLSYVGSLGYQTLTHPSPELTDTYFIDSCNNEHGLAVYREVRYGTAIRQSPCYMGEDKNDRVRTDLLFFQETQEEPRKED